jgi:AcrR family transcriptional regulator
VSKTIKQIADELGVSKTAIRKRFTDEFKSNYVQTNPDGSLQVSDEGCKLIAESLRKPEESLRKPEESLRKPEESLRKPVETPQTKFAETSENQGLQDIVNVQKETIALLKGELTEKNEQIRQLTAALESTAAALTAAQALHAADKKTLMLIEEQENKRKLSFWERRAAKKAEKKARKA